MFIQRMITKHGKNKLIAHHQHGKLKKLSTIELRVTPKREASLNLYCKRELEKRKSCSAGEFLNTHVPKHSPYRTLLDFFEQVETRSLIEGAWTGAHDLLYYWVRDATSATFVEDVRVAMQYDKECDKVREDLALHFMSRFKSSWELVRGSKSLDGHEYKRVFIESDLKENAALVMEKLGRRITTKANWKTVDKFAMACSLWGESDLVRMQEAAYCALHVAQVDTKNTAILRGDLIYATLKLSGLLNASDIAEAERLAWEGITSICGRRSASAPDHRLVAMKRSEDCVVTSVKMATLEGHICAMLDQQTVKDPSDLLKDNAALESKFQSQSEHACRGEWLVAAAVQEMRSMSYAPTSEQVSAVVTQLCCSMSAVIAPAGTGKTDVVTAIFNACMRLLDARVIYATPSHATKRPLCEALEMEKDEVHTVHSLVFKDNGEHARLHRLLAECEGRVHILLDEAGMVDSELLGKLCDAILSAKAESKSESELEITLSMVGDIHQLAPVGMGEPLSDLVRSETIPVARLTRVFRSPDPELTALGEMYRAKETESIPRQYIMGKKWNPGVVTLHTAMNKDDTLKQLKTVLEQCKRDGYTPRVGDGGDNDGELMVICPNGNFDCDDTALGCTDVAKCIRRVYDGVDSSDRAVKGQSMFFTSNTRFYKNGDRTVVREVVGTSQYGKPRVRVGIELDQNQSNTLQRLIDEGHHVDKVPLGARWETRENTEFKMHRWTFEICSGELKPTSCTTVHAAQGSQARRVILVLPPNFETMRNCDNRIIYTSITRSRESLVIIGNVKAVMESSLMCLPIKRKQTTLFCMCERDNCAVDLTADFASSPSLVRARTRRPIPRTLRIKLWNRDFEDRMWGECWVCKKRLSCFNFHAAHEVADACGGETSLDNLVVSCATCNLSAQTMHFGEFRARKRPRPEAFTPAQEDQMMKAISANARKKWKFGERSMVNGTRGNMLPDCTRNEREINVDYMIACKKLRRVQATGSTGDPYDVLVPRTGAQ